jgi:hypothetical protein
LISRQEAKARGLTRYFTGEACLRGHIAQRLYPSGNCVECFNSGRRVPSRPKHPRRIAIERGEPTYMTGELCPEGHIAPRWTSNGSCSVCRNERRNRRRKTDVEFVQRELGYRDANRDKINARSAQWQKGNPERHRARQRDWRARNPEKTIEYHRHQWATNAANRKKSAKEWRGRNPEHMRMLSANARAIKRRACPWWVDREALKAFYLACPPGMVVDHRIPLGGKGFARTADGHPVCGLHVPENLQYLARTANQRKYNRMRREDQEFVEQ